MCPRILHFRDYMYLRIRIRVVSLSVFVLHNSIIYNSFFLNFPPVEFRKYF